MEKSPDYDEINELAQNAGRAIYRDLVKSAHVHLQGLDMIIVGAAWEGIAANVLAEAMLHCIDILTWAKNARPDEKYPALQDLVDDIVESAVSMTYKFAKDKEVHKSNLN